MYPLVLHLHKFIASKVINKLTESSVPTAVLHITTTDSSTCILPISSPIDAKHCRNVRQHRLYQSSPRAQDFVQPIDLSEPNIIVAPQTDNLVVPQPCAAVFVTLVHSKHENEHASVLPESTHRAQMFCMKLTKYSTGLQSPCVSCALQHSSFHPTIPSPSSILYESRIYG